VTFLSQPPPDLILQLPDFGDRLPLFLWPVQGPVTSGFGLRRSGWHKGVDIKADRGASIVASASGLVVASGIEPRYGRVVKIEHENGFLTVYAHNDRNLVRVGDRVLAGQTIAAIGHSGRATAPHLHFEIRHDGCTYDPLYLLNWPKAVAVVSARVSSQDDSSHD
jgi:murein DD-endopeptidase MepM/ murein hydrolase activator NlpD